jgi:hypothetical protein
MFSDSNRNQSQRAYKTATSSDNAVAYKGEDNQTYIAVYDTVTDSVITQQLKQYNDQKSQYDALVFDKNDNLYSVWDNDQTAPYVRVHKWTKPTGGWTAAISASNVDTVYTTATPNSNSRNSGHQPRRLCFVTTAGGDYLVYFSGNPSRTTGGIEPWVAQSFRCSDLSKVDQINPWWGGIGPDAYSNTYTGNSNISYHENTFFLQPSYGANKLWAWMTRFYSYYGDYCAVINVGNDGKMVMSFNFNQGSNTGIYDQNNTGAHWSVIPIKDNLVMIAYDRNQNGHPSFKTAADTISLSALKVSGAYSMALPLFETAANTTSRTSFNLSEAYSKADPSVESAAKTNSFSSLHLSEAY